MHSTIKFKLQTLHQLLIFIFYYRIKTQESYYIIEHFMMINSVMIIKKKYNKKVTLIVQCMKNINKYISLI